MGSIIRRGNYQYQARVSRFRNGQRFFYETRTFETKEEAKAWVTEVESKLNSGTYVSRRETESTTLEEALDRYKQEISSLKKAMLPFHVASILIRCRLDSGGDSHEETYIPTMSSSCWLHDIGAET